MVGGPQFFASYLKGGLSDLIYWFFFFLFLWEKYENWNWQKFYWFLRSHFIVKGSHQFYQLLRIPKIEKSYSAKLPNLWDYYELKALFPLTKFHMNQPKLATLLVTVNYLQKKLLSFDTSKFYLPTVNRNLIWKP